MLKASCLSSRSESETRGHHRPPVDDSADARSLQLGSSTSDPRTSAGPTFTTSPAIDAGTAVPRTPHDIQPCATARGPLLSGPTRSGCSSSPHDDFCASCDSDFPSPSVSPGQCAHAAEPHHYDQSKLVTKFGNVSSGPYTLLERATRKLRCPPVKHDVNMRIKLAKFESLFVVPAKIRCREVPVAMKYFPLNGLLI